MLYNKKAQQLDEHKTIDQSWRRYPTSTHPDDSTICFFGEPTMKQKRM